MDGDTLEDDLDLILGPQPSGEWDWEPRLGGGVSATTLAGEPEETDEPEETEDSEAGSATDPADEDDEDD